MKNLTARAHWNYLFLTPLFAVALLYQITYTVEVIRVEAQGTRVAVVPFTRINGAVDAVSKEAEKAGLHSGDRIITVNGARLAGDRDLHELVKGRRPHDLITLTVVPQGQAQTRTVRVPLAAHDTKPPTVEDWALAIILSLAMLLCTAVGIYAAAVRPRDPRAIFFFGL